MLALLTVALGLVIADASIVTLDEDHPHARNAAIVDGRFAYVGDDLQAARRAAGRGAKEIDALGTTVVPGFNDAHVHFGLSFTLGAPDALDFGAGAADRAAFDRAIEEAAAKPVLPTHHDWIFVTSRTLPDGVRTNRDLPRIDRPLVVVTERGALFNKLALARTHLSATDAPDGQVRGRLIPAALDRAVKSLDKPILFAAAKRFLAECARLGLTSVQLMDELPEIFQTLHHDRELTARIRMMVFGYRFETPLYIPHFVSDDEDWVKVDALKYFDDDWARLPRRELRDIYTLSQGTGRPVVLHLLSRAALRSLLDQLDQLERILPGGAVHFRIDHADEVPPELAARLARLHMIVCPNPAMLPEWKSDRAFPMRTLIDAGVTVCIGTDYVGKHMPERKLAPLSSLSLAATHGGFGTQQRVSAIEALRAYTRGSAAAEGRTDVGVIRVGALGDLVGLSADPTRVAPEDIDKISVRYTVVGGRVVYEHRPPPLMRAATPPQN